MAINDSALNVWPNLCGKGEKIRKENDDESNR
jgi:hypothetical protein